MAGNRSSILQKSITSTPESDRIELYFNHYRDDNNTVIPKSFYFDPQQDESKSSVEYLTFNNIPVPRKIKDLQQMIDGCMRHVNELQNRNDPAADSFNQNLNKLKKVKELFEKKRAVAYKNEWKKALAPYPFNPDEIQDDLRTLCNQYVSAQLDYKELKSIVENIEKDRGQFSLHKKYMSLLDSELKSYTSRLEIKKSELARQKQDFVNFAKKMVRDNSMINRKNVIHGITRKFVLEIENLSSLEVVEKLMELIELQVKLNNLRNDWWKLHKQESGLNEVAIIEGKIYLLEQELKVLGIVKRNSVKDVSADEVAASQLLKLFELLETHHAASAPAAVKSLPASGHRLPVSAETTTEIERKLNNHKIAAPRGALARSAPQAPCSLINKSTPAAMTSLAIKASAVVVLEPGVPLAPRAASRPSIWRQEDAVMQTSSVSTTIFQVGDPFHRFQS